MDKNKGVGKTITINKTSLKAVYISKYSYRYMPGMIRCIIDRAASTTFHKGEITTAHLTGYI